MRVLLLTDSLGCPRREIGVERTWTDRIIRKWSGKDVFFYTYCQHGLYTQNIRLEYVQEIKPDIVVCQIGVVDACRRAMTKGELEFIMKIPVLSKVVNRVCKMQHYFLSRIRNIHYTKKKDFSKFFAELSQCTSLATIVIDIAPPGEYFIKTIYNVEKDIADYNNIIKKYESEKFKIIHPYNSHEPQSYLLEDGHHLNDLGLELVYNEVDRVLQELIGDKKQDE